MSLAFREDGTFKIVQLTDVHWVDGSREDQRTAALMRRILREERPDLIAITGDLVYGERNLQDLPAALAPVLETGAPWAYVFGNHDTEWGHSRGELCEAAMRLPGCLMQRGDPDIAGVGNYVLPLRDAAGRLRWALYFLDSGDYNRNESVGGYGCIERSQIGWYLGTARRLREEEGEHSALSFFHIALPEYDTVWSRFPCKGEKHEEICCPNVNTGMFAAMLDMGNMRGVFVGHDHVCDYEGTLYGVRLCFGRCTGYNTYGEEGFAKGARVIELNAGEPDAFRSWLRLDDGTVRA